jgi:hypothetical protein
VAEILAGRTEAMSKRLVQPLKKAEWQPLPPSLEEAFEAIEQLDSRHPDSRGTSYAGIRVAETRDVARRMAQDAS